ncbi:polyprenyl synthetase family protein [Rubritalea marina]|uniref:polyprenyl synthetase family protein n=1 Tax=Rubritalea marina TaxID=361055 RepID=UPI00037A1233|nr:polyprenyl synthetase family protein [Rubritalea marina]
MALLKPFSDQKSRLAFDLVRKEIKQVEKQISEQVRAFDPEIEAYIDYICNTSGKRIRPALAILAGGALGSINNDNLKIGVIFELIHMATLVHDDVIDEAETRRKIATPNAKWGNGMAVLLGDALFSHSLLLATEFGKIEICAKVGKASREVCQGEVLQTQKRFDISLSVDEYFRIIAMKTGALFAASASISASLSGADEATEANIYAFGLNLGTAFQIYDDCLDLVGSEDTVGKTLRTDLEKGKLTLPLLKLLESASPETKKQLTNDIKAERPLDFESLVGNTAYTAAIQDSLDTASQMLEDGRAKLHGLPDNKYTEGLIEITQYLEGLIRQCHKSC